MGLHFKSLYLALYYIFFVVVVVCFSRQSFSVALEPVLELALVDQAGLKFTEIHPASASQVLGLKACATIAWWQFQNLKNCPIKKARDVWEGNSNGSF